MRNRRGTEIDSVLRGSPAWRAGLRPGDVLRSINSHAVSDAIDFMFYKGSENLEIAFYRNGAVKSTMIGGGNEGDAGITIKPFKVRTCRNNCLFCFVKQLPRGLRKSLYVRDEDYRLSFLYGNYMTLSNLQACDKERIVEQRLSPLYISVHSTNSAVRNRMLGNPKAPDIRKELKFFADNKIRMHTQIVLCPGYNDGKELQGTIKDLYKFYPYVSSIAVVPVGLTSHRKHQVKPLSEADAVKALETVEAFQKRYMKNHGDPVVYCSDEMYIRAARPFPSIKFYGVLPQIENGVGMVPLFLNQARKARMPKHPLPGKSVLAITGTSFYPYLKKFADRLSAREGVNIEVTAVENNFFGTSVTVAGLLTGRDIIKSLHDNTYPYDVVLIPEVSLKEDDDVFLDDVSLEDIREATGLKIMRVEASPQGLIDAVAGPSPREEGVDDDNNRQH
jgi:putative radical SAM enzyme (TIGR03279 family)